jgi:anti-sigma factor RsiW
MTDPGQTHLEETLLHEYLDRELDSQARVAVEAHLGICPSCAERLAMVRALFVSLESLPDAPLPRPLDSAVLARIGVRPAVPRALRVALAAQLALGALILVLNRHWLIRFLTAATSVPLQDRFAASVDGALHSLIPFSLRIGHTIASLPNPVVALVSRLPAIPLAAPQWGAVMAGAMAVWLVGNGLLLRSAHVERKGTNSIGGGADS